LTPDHATPLFPFSENIISDFLNKAVFNLGLEWCHSKHCGGPGQNTVVAWMPLSLRDRQLTQLLFYFVAGGIDNHESYVLSFQPAFH